MLFSGNRLRFFFSLTLTASFFFFFFLNSCSFVLQHFILVCLHSVANSKFAHQRTHTHTQTHLCRLLFWPLDSSWKSLPGKPKQQLRSIRMKCVGKSACVCVRVHWLSFENDFISFPSLQFRRTWPALTQRKPRRTCLFLGLCVFLKVTPPPGRRLQTRPTKFTPHSPLWAGWHAN